MPPIPQPGQIEPDLNGIVPGKKVDPLKKSKKIVGPIAFLFVVVIGVLLGSAAQGQAKKPEVVPQPSVGGGTVNCNDWGAPTSEVRFQDLITKAANETHIQPAVLGAIFMSEHGNWEPSIWNAPDDGKWARSPSNCDPKDKECTSGPFQIKNWPSKWAQVMSRQNDTRSEKKIYPVPLITDTVGDPDNFYHSALASAGVIRTVADEANYDLMTTDETEIRCIGAGYNGGPAMCTRWKEGKYDAEGNYNKDANNGAYFGNPPTTDKYHDRTLNNFKILYDGCKSTTISPATSNKPDPSWDKTYYQDKKDEAKYKFDWIKKLGDPMPTIQVKGIEIMSEPGGGLGIQKEIDNLSEDEEYAHLIVGQDGKVYQMLPINARIKNSNDDAASFAIIIQVSQPPPDAKKTIEQKMLENKPQIDALVKTIEYLQSTYNIENLKGDKANLLAHKGIFGSFQTRSESGVWGKGTMQGCYNISPDVGISVNPGKGYIRAIWKALGATPIDKDCIGK